MDTKLLLIKAITLLFLQGELSERGNDERINNIIDKVLEAVKPAERSITTDFGHDTITQLRDTLVWMKTHDTGFSYDTEALKQRFILITQDENYLYKALCSMFSSVGRPDEMIEATLRTHLMDINAALNKNAITSVIKDIYRKLQFNPETVDWGNLDQDIQQSLAQYVGGSSTYTSALEHNSVVHAVDFGDIDSINTALEMSKDELSSDGVIRTPFKGVNRMLGRHGGFRRGEQACVSALQHKYKSGMLMDLFLGTALFNTPYMRDPSKKPLNLRLSFENSVQVDMANLYERLWEMENNVRADMTKVDTQEASNYVNERLKQGGYENRLVHIDPSDYTYLDLFNLIEDFESQGYEIHMVTCDYLNMISKRGCNIGPHGEDIRDLFRRVRNFFNKKGITFITAHQLSTQAKDLLREGQNNFVQRIAGQGYYDGCKRIDQELDLEIYIHIVEVNGEKYLTIQRGKHRGVRTPQSDQYTVYKFDEISGLPFDVLGDDQSRKTVGGSTISDGGQAAWYEGI